MPKVDASISKFGMTAIKNDNQMPPNFPIPLGKREEKDPDVVTFAD